MKYDMKYDFTLIFGKKGSGKTSFLAKMALKYSKRGITVFCTEEHVENTCYIPLDFVGKFWLPENSLLLIDELSVAYNSRSFKTTSLDVLKYFKYSRHNRVKIIAFTQVFDDSDKQIRMLADKMYLAKNMGFFAVYRRIRKVIDIRTNADGVGQIVDSFEKCPILGKGNTLFCSLSRYRKYFDSYSRLDIPDLPMLPAADLDTSSSVNYDKAYSIFKNLSGSSARRA